MPKLIPGGHPEGPPSAPQAPPITQRPGVPPLLGGLLIASLSLAGCVSDAPGDPTDPPGATPTQATQGETPTATPTSAPTPPPSEEASPTQSEASPTASLGQGSGTPVSDTPTASPQSDTPTQAPTATPGVTTPSPSPTPTSTSAPTPTAGGTATPTATVTSALTPTPTATATPTSTATAGLCEPISDFSSVTILDFANRFNDDIYPFVTTGESTCTACHSTGASLSAFELGVGGVDTFDRLRADGYLQPAEVTNSMLDRLTRPVSDGESMPLGGAPWSDEAITLLSCLVDDLIAWEDAGGEVSSCEDSATDPGRVTLRRLNRSEYNRTVQDLMGTDASPAEDFPADDTSYGYDTIADVLTLSPLHVEKYDSAAEALILEALGARPEPVFSLFEAEELGSDVGSSTGYGWVLSNNGEIVADIEATATGEYILSAQAWADQAGPDPARMTFSIDGEVLTTIDVLATYDAPTTYSFTAQIEEGPHTFAVAFINDYWKPLGPPEVRGDRNLIVDSLELLGPFNALPDPSPTRDAIVTCSPEAIGVAPCAREILGNFGLRAWRRPLEEDELQGLLSIVELVIAEGDDFEAGLRYALNALLLSPHFIFRVELDEDPTSLEPHPLTDFELATRLSYFLWGSTPDSTLLDLAAAGELQNSTILMAQVERMLADPKAWYLVEGFGSQWLTTQHLESFSADPEAYPDFDEPLRAAMATEAQLYFAAFLFEDRSALDIMDADFTFVNERLAEHYGLEGIEGDEFVSVTLPDAQFGGLLGKSGILSVTSHADRTSPVRRGKWVLEQLLCQPPPPPPAGVEGLPENTDDDASIREQMEAHRADPVCASCHEVMDPIGFSLDNYSVIGKWRELDDAGQPVDATGELPDGRTFDGPEELAQVLKHDEALPGCMTQQVLTYALGRGPDLKDECAIGRLEGGFAEGDYRLESLITELVLSSPFRNRRGESEPTEAPQTPTPTEVGQ